MRMRENEVHIPKVIVEYDNRTEFEWVEIDCIVCGNRIDEYYSIAKPAKVEYCNYCQYCGARLKEDDGLNEKFAEKLQNGELRLEKKEHNDYEYC